MPPGAPESPNDPPTESPCVNRQSEIVNHLPVFDRSGALLDHVPRTGPNSIPTFSDPLSFTNSAGDTICWLNPTHISDAPPLPRAAVLNKAGEIVNWHAGLDPFANPPSPRAVPIHCRRYNRTIAWLDESARLVGHSSHPAP